MNKREAIKIFKDYLTGKISTEYFWERLKSDEELRDILVKDKKRKKGIIKTKDEVGIPIILRYHDKNYPINPDNMLQAIDISRLDHRYILFGIINRFLLMRGIVIPETDYNVDAKEYLFLQSLQPNYADIENVALLQKIYNEAPASYSKNKKILWCKNHIKEMFPFDDKAPEWYQAPNWPWKNGEPMVFSHQETSPEGVELYYFYDKSSKEQVIVEQIE